MAADPLADVFERIVRDVVRDELAKAVEELQAIVRSAGPPARYLTVDEAAQVANVGRTKLRQAIGTGELPVTRRGRLVRIPVDALDAWMATG
jgi:excisionase family DNA binding protein